MAAIAERNAERSGAASSTEATGKARALAVEPRSVGKRFALTTAVNNLNLSLAAGQTDTPLGPNGAGQSTTIAMLLGPLAPEGARVRCSESRSAKPSPRVGSGQ